MNAVNKITKIVARILEVVHWVGAGFMAALAFCSAFTYQWVGYIADLESVSAGIRIYGFEILLTDAAGEVNRKALLLLAICGLILFALMAMVFRNVYLIMKKSEGTTPFQKDNIRMLREIGIFAIAVPVVSFIMSVISRLVVGVDVTEASVDLSGFVMGVIVLSLTQFFAYGAQLEKDVDGLL